MFINLAVVIWLFYLLAFPVRLDIIHNEPFPVYPEVVAIGQEIVWEVEFTKTNNYPATINRNIICADGNLVTLSSDETNVPESDRRIAKGSAFIPRKTSLGVCYIELKATYHINPIRDIQRTYVTRNFRVIE
jgi:hypothetical protein